MTDFVAYGFKAITQFIIPALRMKFDRTPGEFDSFKDVHDMFEGGIQIPKSILDGHLRTGKEFGTVEGDDWL